MKLKWKYVSWLIYFLFISSIVIDWKMTIDENFDPLALGNIISGFERFFVFTLLGTKMVFNYETMICWIEDRFSIRLPVGRFRFLGSFFICASLLPLALSVNIFLSYLGLIPNPYTP